MLLAALGHYFFGITIFILSFFLILLVLVQRGRGGGIAGALGGPGGQSAFGTKAGDLFTRITIGVAALWIVVCGAAVYFLQDSSLSGIGTDTIVGSGDAPTLGAPEGDSVENTAPESPAPENTTPEVEAGDLGGELDADADSTAGDSNTPNGDSGQAGESAESQPAGDQ